jgi:hypothetical protein
MSWIRYVPFGHVMYVSSDVCGTCQQASDYCPLLGLSSRVTRVDWYWFSFKRTLVFLS